MHVFFYLFTNVTGIFNTKIWIRSNLFRCVVPTDMVPR